MRFVRTGTQSMRAAAALAMGFGAFVSRAFAIANPDATVAVPHGHFTGPGKRSVLARSLGPRGGRAYKPGSKRRYGAGHQFREHLTWLERRAAKEASCAT